MRRRAAAGVAAVALAASVFAGAAGTLVAHAILVRGEITTQAGSPASGLALTLGQQPFAVASAGTHVLVGDSTNPVLRDIDTSSHLETPLAGNDGYGYAGDGGLATSAMIEGAGAIANCGPGLTYFADTNNFVIRRVDLGGNITTVVGTGQKGYSGDGGPGTLAQIGHVYGISCVVAGSGLWIADADNGVLRLFDSLGNINTYYSNFAFPVAVTEDPAADIFVADAGTNTVWRIDGIDGKVSRYAGNGTAGYSGDSGLATSAQLNFPFGLASPAYNKLYISDAGNNAIRFVDGGGGAGVGPISTVAGNGTAGFAGDGGLASTAQFNQPVGLAMDIANHYLYIADNGNYRVRRIDLNPVPATISSIAGNGTPSWSGDGLFATQAQLGNPYAVSFDIAGNEYVADNQNSAIREVDLTGHITTVAGNGVAGFSPDGTLATLAQLRSPKSVVLDGAGNMYVSDSGNQLVRKVDHVTHQITTIAGNGTAGYSGEGMPATNFELNTPRGIAVDGAGNVFIADTLNDRVRMVTPGGTISTFAGDGTTGYFGDGGPATAAELNFPRGLAFNASGDLFISDSGNNVIRKVDHLSGNISTVAGNGTSGVGGDDGPATKAQLNFPFGIAFDAAGNIYVADELNQSVRLVDTHGFISTVVAECGVLATFSGDLGPAMFAHVNYPYGVGVDPSGNLYIADVNNNRVREAVGLAGLRPGACVGLGAPPPSRDAATLGPGGTASLRIADRPGQQPTAGLRSVFSHAAGASTTPQRVVTPPVSRPAQTTQPGAAAAPGPRAHGIAGIPPALVRVEPPKQSSLKVVSSLRPAAALAAADGPGTPGAVILLPFALISALLLGLRRRKNRRLNDRSGP
jgi:sugar lactone lactonase YvrE